MNNYKIIFCNLKGEMYDDSHMLRVVFVLVLFYFMVSKQHHVNEVHSIYDTGYVASYAAERNDYDDPLKTDDMIKVELGTDLETYIRLIATSLNIQNPNNPIGYVSGSLESQQRKNYQQHFFNAMRALRETGRAPRLNSHMTLYTTIIALDMFRESEKDWPYTSEKDPINPNADFDICLAVGKTEKTKKMNMYVSLEETSPQNFAMQFIIALVSNDCMDSNATFVVSPNVVLYQNKAMLPKSHANQFLLHNMGNYWDAYLIEPNHTETYPGQMKFYEDAFEVYRQAHFFTPERIKQIVYRGFRYNTCELYDHGGLCSIMTGLEVIGPLPTFEAMKMQTFKWLQHAYKKGRDVTQQLESPNGIVVAPFERNKTNDANFFFDNPMTSSDWDIVKKIYEMKD